MASRLSVAWRKTDARFARDTRACKVGLGGGTMPTKKQPTVREHEVARKKNHPVSKTSRVAVAQNGEAEPRPTKRRE
jgi:hypothetical protein